MLQQQEGQTEVEVDNGFEKEEQVKLPTLDEFLGWGAYPNNSYLEEPGFSSLYVRKGPIAVSLDGVLYRCIDTLTIASVAAKEPGNGTFTRFVERLVEKGLTVFVENTHNERLRGKLLKLGFTRVDGNQGLNFLYNYEEHIVLVTVRQKQCAQSMETPIKMIVVQFASEELAIAAVNRLEAIGLSAAGISYRRRSCSIRFEFTDIDSVSRTLAKLQAVLGCGSTPLRDDEQTKLC